MDKISSILDAAESLPVPARPVVEDAAKTVDQETKRFAQRVKDNREIDYDEARSNFKEMIGQTMELIPSLVSLVREAESPRMYEAASAFIKMVSELNNELIDLSEKAAGEKVSGKGMSVPAVPVDQSPGEARTDVIFIGTSEELMEKMAERRRQRQSASNSNVIDVESVPVK